MRLTTEQVQKAAVLFLSLEKIAPGVIEPIISGMESDHAKTILGAMSEMNCLSPERCQSVIKEFYAVAFDNESIYGGSGVTARIATAVFGEDQTSAIIKNNKDRFRFLDNVSDEDIVQFLGTETNQAKTLLFHFLSPKKASQVLLLLGDDPVVFSLDKGVSVPSPDLLDEVEVAWAAYFDRLQQERSSSDDASVRKIASMIEYLPKSRRESLLKGYSQRSPELAQRLRQLVFTFDDLMDLPDETLRTMMSASFDYRHVAHLRLQLQEDWVAKINRCMTDKMLSRVDIETSGLTFDQERTDEAKRYFMETARKLEQEGRVTLRCQN